MEEEKYQKELFEFEEPKKPFSKLTNMLPKRDFEGKIALSLTLEKIVFLFIGIVMTMVLVFAMGVENGKSRGNNAKTIKAAKAIPSVASMRAAASPQARPLQVDSAVAPQKGFFNTAPAAPQVRTIQSNSGAVPAKPYTIVAAAFSKKETARAAAAFLIKEGVSASVVFSDPYYRVCVGSYADMYGAQVQKDLAKVKRIYKDAFIRVR